MRAEQADAFVAALEAGSSPAEAAAQVGVALATAGHERRRSLLFAVRCDEAIMANRPAWRRTRAERLADIAVAALTVPQRRALARRIAHWADA